MADFVTTALASVEATLLVLYAKREKSMSQKDRAIVFADIERLETSRRGLLAEQARTAGTRPRIASIDLQTGPASSSEGE